MSTSQAIELATLTIRHPHHSDPELQEGPSQPRIPPENESSVSKKRSNVDEKTYQLHGHEDPANYPDGGFKAYSVIFGSFLGLIVNLGLINSIGAIQAYVSTHQLVDMKATSISWIFSIYLSLAYAGGVVTGPIFDRKGPLSILILSTIFIFAGLMGAANSTNIWQFILSFISLGIGNGMGMTPLIGVISHWFLKKRGNCTGLATSGGSVGGLIFPLMLRHAYSQYGYVWAIRILAFICLGLMILSILLVKERFSSEKDNKSDSEEEEVEVEVEHQFNNKWQQFITKFAAKMKLADSKYILVVFGTFFSELSLILLLTYFATYAMAQGASESSSYILLTVWNGAGILGRWIPGYISDYMGRFNINILMLIGYNFCILVLLYPFAGSNIRVLYAFAILGGYCLGSILSLVPACLSQITPVNEIGTKYGILNFVLSLANLFGIPIAASIIKHGTTQEYNHFIILVGCLAVTGTIFWYLSRVAIVGFKMNVKV